MGHRILLVDDEAALRSMLVRVLRGEEYEVTEAADGFDGWALVQRTRFDLVITDNRMPRLNGPEFIRRLQDLHPTLPILRLSGSSHAEEERLDHVTTLLKPFDLDRLLDVVRSILVG